MPKNKHTEQLEFRFLRDQPLRADDEFETIEFGHKEISKTLVSIVEKCETPFTVGLFGKWGSGKSTIANLLAEDLKLKGIPTVIFDAWKHEGVALRRTFLKDMVNQLKKYESFFDNDFTLDDRLEHSVSKQSEGEFKINFKKIIEAGKLWIIFGTISVLILAIISYISGIFNQFLYGFSILSAISFGGVFVTWLLKNATQFLTTETTTYGTDKFEDPCDFQDEFSRVIREGILSEGLEKKRILIVFDNIDRVTPDKAVEVLKTIKTFLEPTDIEIENREVVFLIPCDSVAISRHIQSIYFKSNSNRTDEPDEFLRKFFNSMLWIPEFISSEMEAYTRKILQYTQVAELNNDKIAWLIIKEFRQNPRQIKQFVNTLLSNYLFIKLRQGDGKDFPLNFLSNNLPQLAKYLILTQKFPEEMSILRRKYVFNLEKTDLHEIFKNEIKRHKEFIEFVEETRTDFPITNLKIFYTLRRSEQEKKFPGIEEFLMFLEDNTKLNEAKNYVSNLNNLTKDIESFSQVIKQEINQKTNTVAASNLINSLLLILDQLNIKLTDTVYGEIYNKLTGVAKEQLHIISPSILEKQLLANHPRYRRRIVNQWIVDLEKQFQDKPTIQFKEDYMKELIGVFIKKPDYLKYNINEFRNIITSNYFIKDWIVELFANSKKSVQAELLDERYLVSYIDGIKTEDELDWLESAKKIGLLLRFNPILFNESSLNLLMDKFTELNENSGDIKSDIDFLEAYLDSHRKLFVKCSQQISKIKNKENFQKYADSLIPLSNKLQDWDKRKILIPLCLELEKIISKEDIIKIKNQITSFFDLAKPVSIEYVFDKVNNGQEIIEQSDTYEIFEQRSLREEEFFNYFYEKISNEIKNKLLIKLFDTSPNKAKEKIKAINYKVPNPVSIVEKILDVIDSQSISEKSEFLKICNVLNCGGNAELRGKFVEKIGKLLQSVDLQSQQIGYEALSEARNIKTRRRSMLKEVFDWLRKPGTTDKYQLFSIRAIYLGYEDLNKEEQNEFLQFIFDELIRKATNEKQINLGFEILKQIKPKYKERKQNYNDIKDLIESGKVENFKEILIKGLFELKPNRTNANNKEYWDWVISQNNKMVAASQNNT